METLSRVKKYEKLREQLQNDREVEINTKDISDYVQKVTSTTPVVEETPAHEPVHSRVEEYKAEPVVEQPVVQTPVYEEETVVVPTYDDGEDKFNSDFLNEYIKEVKQYNHQKGLRSAEDTQINILKDIRKGSDPILRPFGDIEQPKKQYDLPENIVKVIDQQEEMRNTISLEIQSILAAEQEEVKTEPVVEEVPIVEETPVVVAEEPKVEVFTETRTISKVSELAEPVVEEVKSEVTTATKETPTITSEDIENIVISQTREMKIQMDNYENSLDDMNSTVTYTNRLLNIVLIVLIIALLVVLGIIIYWNLMKRGII